MTTSLRISWIIPVKYFTKQQNSEWEGIYIPTFGGWVQNFPFFHFKLFLSCLYSLVIWYMALVDFGDTAEFVKTARWGFQEQGTCKGKVSQLCQPELAIPSLLSPMAFPSRNQKLRETLLSFPFYCTHAAGFYWDASTVQTYPILVTFVGRGQQEAYFSVPSVEEQGRR